MNRLSISISLATLALVAYLVLLYWAWATSVPPRWVNPPVAQIQLAFLDGAQRSGGIVGDQDDNGIQDSREPGWRTNERGWWRDFNPFDRAPPPMDKNNTSTGATRAEGYGRADHGGHERN